jgi:hypothetical protein
MLILLDIDGVMVPATSWRPSEILADGFANFSNRSISSLQKIISETGASILLTTSHKSRYSISEWEQIFKTRGITTVINRLEDNAEGLNRKEEILRWFNTTKTSENFVILDDDKSINGLPAYIKDKVVLTSATVGLIAEQAESAIDILRKQEYATA